MCKINEAYFQKVPECTCGKCQNQVFKAGLRLLCTNLRSVSMRYMHRRDLDRLAHIYEIFILYAPVDFFILMQKGQAIRVILKLTS